MDKKIVPKKCIEQSNLSLFGGGQSGLLPPLPPAVLFFRIFEVASTATGTTSLVIKKQRNGVNSSLAIVKRNKKQAG